MASYIRIYKGVQLKYKL